MPDTKSSDDDLHELFNPRSYLSGNNPGNWNPHVYGVCGHVVLTDGVDSWDYDWQLRDWLREEIK